MSNDQKTNSKRRVFLSLDPRRMKPSEMKKAMDAIRDAERKRLGLDKPEKGK